MPARRRVPPVPSPRPPAAADVNDSPGEPVPPHGPVEVAGGPDGAAGDPGTPVNLFGDWQPRGPVVAGSVPQAPLAFQPREGLMSQLRAAGPGVSVVRAVSGLRGVGKTQLAAAYARECMAAGWRLIAWVNAGDTATALKDLAVVAARLGIDRPGETLEVIAGEIRSRLEADGGQCLVVFDNLADVAVIAPYVPARGSSQVVVTSIETSLPVSREPVAAGVFTQDEALAFLGGRSGLDDPAEAKVLADELGYLPLALAQAAAAIAAQRLSYQDYLGQLRANPARKQLPRPKDAPYPRGVANAILLSVDAVTKADPTGLCTELLGVASVLSAEGVSRDMLHFAGTAGILSGDRAREPHRPRGDKRVMPAAERAMPAETDEALGRLAAASLLTFSTDGTTVLVHRLVTRVMRDRAAREGTLGDLGLQAVRLLDAYPVGDPWKDRANARDCVSQVIALADHFAAFPAETRPGGLLDLRTWAFWCLQVLGDSAAAAIALGESLVAERTQLLGDDHPDTLASRNSLAMAYRAAGRLDEAVPLYERTLADRVVVLGEGHPDTLTSRNNLATAYEAAGRLDEAVPLYEQSLAGLDRVLGADHPRTVLVRENLERGRARRASAEAGPPE